MAAFEEMHTAMVNRSIRTIKAVCTTTQPPKLQLMNCSQELEYLTDASVITPQTLSDLLQRLPQQTALHAPISVGAVPTAPSQAGTLQPPPTTALNNMNLQNNGYGSQNNGYGAQNNGYGANRTNNEKSDSSYYQPTPAATPQPPPAYGAPPGPPPQANYPPLAHATALYAYTSSDAGDLALQPNDQITVTEYMNAEWWKGKSARTGQEGIFPRSYVKVDEKAPPADTTNNYGNAPLEVSGKFFNATLYTPVPLRLINPLQAWVTAKARLPANSRRTARRSARSWATPPSLVPVPPLVVTLSTAFSRLIASLFCFVLETLAFRMREFLAGYNWALSNPRSLDFDGLKCDTVQ
jgi:hypothetical protein